MRPRATLGSAPACAAVSCVAAIDVGARPTEEVNLRRLQLEVLLVEACLGVVNHRRADRRTDAQSRLLGHKPFLNSIMLSGVTVMAI